MRFNYPQMLVLIIKSPCRFTNPDRAVDLWGQEQQELKCPAMALGQAHRFSRVNAILVRKRSCFLEQILKENPQKSPDPLISQRGDNSCCRRQVSLCQSRGWSRSSPGLGRGAHPACWAQAGSCREQRRAAGPLIPGLTQGTHRSVKNRKTNALKQPLRFYPATFCVNKPNAALHGEKPQNKTLGVWMPRGRDRAGAVTVIARNLPQQEPCWEHRGCSSSAPGHLLPHGATACWGPCPPGLEGTSATSARQAVQGRGLQDTCREGSKERRDQVHARILPVQLFCRI